MSDLVNLKLKPLVEYIYGEQMYLFKDKINWKYSGGKGFKAHQDHPAWSDFEPKRFLSVALFANNTTKENGCLEFGTQKKKRKSLSFLGSKLKRRGSKKYLLLDTYSEDLGQLTQEIEYSYDWSHIETTPRDILLFDSYAPHRSGPNTTNQSRRIFYFTYNEKNR